MVTVAVTGHRPEKITNWQFVEHQLAEAYRDFGVTTVIQGMAAGVDLTAAKVAHVLGIPFWSARPWAGHKPRKDDERNYQYATILAERVTDVDSSLHYPGPWVYQKRNEWMVDHAEMLIAVWDGTSGGTANCVKYARKNGIDIWRINPTTHEVGWYDPAT